MCNYETKKKKQQKNPPEIRLFSYRKRCQINISFEKKARQKLKAGDKKNGIMYVDTQVMLPGC